MPFLTTLALRIGGNIPLPPPPSVRGWCQYLHSFGNCHNYCVVTGLGGSHWAENHKRTNSEINVQNPCIRNTLLCTLKIMISFNPCHSIQVVVQSISPNSVLLEDTYIQLVALTTKYRFFLKPDQLSPIICRQAAFTFTLPCSLKDSA